MDQKNPNFDRKSSYSKDYSQTSSKDFSEFAVEKQRYIQRLTQLLEDIRLAALGIDKQSQLELRILEKKVRDKLLATKLEVRKVIEEHNVNIKKLRNQGSLFDE